MSEEEQVRAQEHSQTRESGRIVRYLIPIAEQERFQERFNQFIRAENERLNRLIRNLYLYLQFKHYSERDLYDRICQEVAEYFRASSCELYIVRYEEENRADERSKGLHSRAHSIGNGTEGMSKWLELVGAFGPARRALRQQYVTQHSRSRYEIPMVGPTAKAELTSWTRQAFVDKDPTRYASCVEFRSARPDPSRQESLTYDALRRDAPRHVIWYQDGLYNSCRCSLAAPLVREGKAGASGEDTPYHSRVGLIKLENRAPHAIAGFSDVPSVSVNHDHLFFRNEWGIVALRPYVRDLRESVKKGGDPFLPLHNNVGWQQYFEDHPLGAHHFHRLIRKLRQLRKSQDFRRIAQDLPEKYSDLVKWLESLLECLIRLEAWLQHLRHASRVICGLAEKPTLSKPTPSLFNASNLRAASSIHRSESASSSSASSASQEEERNAESNRYVYDVVRDALLDCLARYSSDSVRSKEQLVTLEASLSAIESFRETIDQLDRALAGDSMPLKDTEALIQNASRSQREIKDQIGKLNKLLEPTKSEALEGLNRDFRELIPSEIQILPGSLREALQGIRASVDLIQMFAEQEAEETIQTLCRQRANAMREALQGQDPTGASASLEELPIEQALEDGLPHLRLREVLETGVLADLTLICKTLKAPNLREREFAYELTREEDEVRRVRKIVQSVLDKNTRLEKRYGVACKLLEPSEERHEIPEKHDELAEAICQTARALAAATMYADSFDQIDEKRLLFIASHIVKVLDSHMLYQARQRGLELDYDALDVLGLEHFGLELLDILHSCSQRIASALHYLHGRETYHSGGEVHQLHAHLLPLKELVEDIAICVNRNSSSDQKKQLTCVLATISSPSPRVSQCVLDQIYQYGIRLGLEVEPPRESEDCPSQITFRPTANLGPGYDPRLAKSVLCLKAGSEGQTDAAGGSVELKVCLPRKALCDRDLRALWSAVNAVGDTLKAVEATTGGTPCY